MPWLRNKTSLPIKTVKNEKTKLYLIGSNSHLVMSRKWFIVVQWSSIIIFTFRSKCWQSTYSRDTPISFGWYRFCVGLRENELIFFWYLSIHIILNISFVMAYSIEIMSIFLFSTVFLELPTRSSTLEQYTLKYWIVITTC